MNEKRKGHVQDADDLGKKIRQERLSRQMTLERFSEMTGLSKSFLSQIERGITEPSITSLKKISKQFGFSVVNLFQNGDSANSGWTYTQPTQKAPEVKTVYIEKAVVVRADRRKRFALPGSNVMYDLLTPDMNRQLEVMYMRVKKDRTPEMNRWWIRREKSGICAERKIEFTVRDDLSAMGGQHLLPATLRILGGPWKGSIKSYLSEPPAF
jgi:transcriptional regulator with XRE-family HTH domain